MAETPLFPFEHGGILRYVLEATYNAGPTVNNSDVRHFPFDATFNSYRRTYRPRRMRSAKISGVKPSAAGAIAEYSLPVEIDHKTISSPTLSATPSGVPECHYALLAGGFVATHDNSADYSGIVPDAISTSAGSNDEILTYTYNPSSQQANSSLRMYWDMLDSAKTEAIRHEMNGCRHGWTLETGPDTGIRLMCNGFGLATKPAKVSSPSIADTLTDITPAEPLGVNLSVHKVLATAATYGKSSETGTMASMTADAWGFQITSNLAIENRVAPGGGLGTRRFLFNPSPLTAQISLDQVQWADDWDLYTFADERRLIRIKYAIPAPGSTTDFILVSCPWFITDYSPPQNTNGYYSVDLTLEQGFPDSSSDGGGLVPDDCLTLQWVSIVAAP